MKRDFKYIDKFLFVILLIFCLLGLVMIYSASSASTILRYNVSSNHFFVRQLIALIGGFVAGFFILCIPTSKYKMLTYLGVIAGFISLILILSYGDVTNNAQSWFKIGGFKVQPSEFVKTIVILFMAFFYNDLDKKKNSNISLYFIPVAVILLLCFLIAKQPDWGSAAIIFAISFFLFISVPLIHKNGKKIFSVGFIGAIIIGLFLVFFGSNILSSEKLSRFNFTKPCLRYQEGSGYQVCNGMIAISNGGLFGLNLGKSTQKYLYLPESHTDFIFPIICEELGAIVGVFVIILYGIFLLRIFIIAKNTSNLRNSLIAYGAFWYFAFHILINLLGVLALMPLTGVPLPFLSYGGSFTLNALILFFLVERINIENHKDKLKRDINNM